MSGMGGAVGRSDRPLIIKNVFYATTNAQGESINAGMNNALYPIEGKTLAEIKRLSTFSGWNEVGKDLIDDQGGTGLTWRIYEGSTTPLLRSFLQQVTVTANKSDIQNKIYDGSVASNQNVGYTASLANAKLEGELGYVTSKKNAGAYSVEDKGLIFNGLYSDQQGYDISYANQSLQIEKAPLVIKADDGAKTYGDSKDFAGTSFTSNGLKNNETIGSVTLRSDGAAATAGVQSGAPYSITASEAKGGSFDAGNYTITYANGALTVAPRALTVTALNASKTYGDALTFQGSEFSASDLKNGDTIGSVTLRSDGAAATASVQSGTPYSITASEAKGGSFEPGNYDIHYVNGQLVVKPLPSSDIAGATPCPMQPAQRAVVPCEVQQRANVPANAPPALPALGMAADFIRMP